MSLKERAQTVEVIAHILRNSPEEIGMDERRVFILAADKEGRLIAVQCATEENKTQTVEFTKELYPEAEAITEYPATVGNFLRYYDSLETVSI